MHVVIIGNGIAGVTTARHLRKQDSKVEITIISSETKHFFSRTALMYIYMGHMRFKDTKPYEDWFWEKNRINLLQDKVSTVDFAGKTLVLEVNAPLKYDMLVFATGSKSNFFNWPGQDLPGVQGLYNFQDLESLNARTPKIKEAVITGGGLIGVELAEMLVSKGIKVNFLVREGLFWGGVLPKEDAQMLEEHIIKDHHVKLMLNEELHSIQGDEIKGVSAVKLKNAGTDIACQFVGITTGVSPNVAFLKDTDLKIERGIVVNEYLETNIPDVYAIGDCAQIEQPTAGRRPIEAVWYVGRMMGECLGKTLGGKQTAYKPGPWFNSAKFFDIEYQTYGTVLAKPQENEERFFWKHPTKYEAIHICFDKNTKEFIGVNVYGYRLRHEILDKQLREKVSVFTFLEELPNANFNPELYRTNEAAIINAFNHAFKTDVRVKKKSWKSIFNLAN